MIGDFDGDGRDELLTRDGELPALVRPDAAPFLLDPEAFVGSRQFRAADMDGDGRDDLLTGIPSMASPAVELYLLHSDGSGFAAARKLPLTGQLADLGVGDLDHDGVLDLASFDLDTRELSICRQGSAGPADRCESRPLPNIPRAFVSAVIEDLDDDGDPDLILEWSKSGTGSFFQVLYGDGTGGLDPAPAQPLVAGTLRRARLGGDRPGWVMLSIFQASLLTTEQAP